MARFARILMNGAPLSIVDEGSGWGVLDGDPLDTWTRGDAVAPPEGPWLPPIESTKIIGIGRSYADHAAERGKPVPKEPMFFLKPSTSAIGHLASIELPGGVGRVDYESELALVIGRTASRVKRDRALDYVFGYTCLNDVTARGLQDSGIQFSHAKGYDTFAPIGPWIVTGLDPSALEIEGVVNGETRQHSNTKHLVFSVAYLVEYVSRVMTLLPGDVIATGTPAGIGALAVGDVVTVRVEGIGELTNDVIAGPPGL